MLGLAVIELVPKKVYAALVAATLLVGLALGAAVLTLRVKLADGAAEYARLETKVERERVERERVAREDAQKVAKDQLRHAEIQQRNAHAYHEQAAADAARAAADRADLDVLRGAVAAYARGGDEAAADGAACRGARDRAERLGTLVQEALQLQGESESFIRQRDREVRLLLDTLDNDRSLMVPKEPLQ